MERTAGEVPLCGGALCSSTRQGACEDSFADTCDRNSQVKGSFYSPAAGSLLARAVNDNVNERLSGFIINMRENFCSDFNQVGVKIALVPFPENVGDLCWLHVRAVAEQVVGLANNLHIGILNAVVDHLHKVARTVRADVGAARSAVNLRGNRFQ